ncbi:MAG TPA: hypothetical protein VLT32_14750 [Candidatus Sulfomarinibacteraceae bacterium]|nr:hypothetical protein [Candidatus Sulfomarinibacteraceae bacterium]
MFNGTHRIVGAGTAAATGEEYMNIIFNRSFDPAPIKIEVDSFNPTTGATSATVTMVSTTYSLAGADFNIVLLEEDVNTAPTTYDDTHVARALYSESITLSGAGNTAPFNTTFAIDPGWNTSNLRVVAFVQVADQSIIQTGSSYPMPDFKARAMVPFSRTVIGPGDAPYESDPLTVMNVGLTDTFTISATIDEAPPGWTVAFRDGGGTLHTDPLAFGLAGDAQTTFTAVVIPVSAGYARYHLTVTSPNMARPLEIPFTYITDTVDAMLVDDDGGEAFEDYFTTALQNSGVSYGVWDRGASALTAEVAQITELLIWNAGWAFPSLDADDQTFLTQYLGDGKALFISGQDVGWDLVANGGGAAFYQNVLHTTYIRDDTNIYDLNGVAGDPITDGLTLRIIGGTGASNQEYPDEIAPADGDAAAILNYQGDGCGAIRATDSVSGAKIVNLGFGFEAIDSYEDQRALMVPAVHWLLDIVFADGFEDASTGAWTLSVP